MRPIRMQLAGFGAFRDNTVVDFADLDLAALVGPTGSGKSTIIDALTFALYGSVARYDDPKLVAPIIHQLSAEARVMLDFEIGGSMWRATRVVRRTSGGRSRSPRAKTPSNIRATTREARLELVAKDGSTSVVGGTVTELDAEVRRLIGLDFHQFTRTIVLPQGDFAEFLKDSPSNRQKLLRQLLDIDIYSKMGALARERASAAGTRVEVLKHELVKLSGVTADTLAQAEFRVRALQTFESDAKSSLDELAAIDTELSDLRTQVNQIDNHLGALAAVKVPDGLEETNDAIEQAQSALEAAAAALLTARRNWETQQTARNQNPDPAVLAHQIEQSQDRQHLDRKIKENETKLAEARAQNQQLADTLTQAEAEAEAAAVALRAIDVGAGLAPIQACLVTGEPCPVCDQTVHQLPTGTDLAQLEQARQAEQARVEQARAAIGQTSGALNQIRAMVATLDARVDEQRQQKQRLEAKLGTVSLEELEARLAGVQEVDIQYRRAEQEVKAAESARDDAGRAVERLAAQERQLTSQYMAHRDTVSGLEPPPPTGATATDWVELGRWASTQILNLSEQRDTVARAGKSRAAAKAELVGALTSQADDLGVAVADMGELKASIAGAIATAQAEVRRIGEVIDRQQELADSISELKAEQAVSETLGRKHLSASGFERWLLSEALDAIVAHATIRLLELSAGRYSLGAENGLFFVLDHSNADERRDVRTLSGGEVFLASLALALALADSIAELAPVDAPRLESIFLDEGFGTLDSETLDLVATAIEELSVGGRLVMIVTHVRDLAERMPVRFEVVRTPIGSTVNRSEG